MFVSVNVSIKNSDVDKEWKFFIFNYIYILLHKWAFTRIYISGTTWGQYFTIIRFLFLDIRNRVYIGDISNMCGRPIGGCFSSIPEMYSKNKSMNCVAFFLNSIWSYPRPLIYLGIISHITNLYSQNYDSCDSHNSQSDSKNSQDLSPKCGFFSRHYLTLFSLTLGFIFNFFLVCIGEKLPDKFFFLTVFTYWGYAFFSQFLLLLVLGDYYYEVLDSL